LESWIARELGGKGPREPESERARTESQKAREPESKIGKEQESWIARAVGT